MESERDRVRGIHHDDQMKALNAAADAAPLDQNGRMSPEDAKRFRQELKDIASQQVRFINDNKG